MSESEPTGKQAATSLILGVVRIGAAVGFIVGLMLFVGGMASLDDDGVRGVLLGTALCGVFAVIFAGGELMGDSAPARWFRAKMKI